MACPIPYPKTLVLPLHLLPYTVAELNVRLQALIAFSTDIFVLQNGESIRLWKQTATYDADGLDYISACGKSTTSGSNSVALALLLSPPAWRVCS